jgi:hypothetical protein
MHFFSPILLRGNISHIERLSQPKQGWPCIEKDFRPTVLVIHLLFIGSTSIGTYFADTSAPVPCNSYRHRYVQLPASAFSAAKGLFGWTMAFSPISNVGGLHIFVRLVLFP